SRSGTHPPGLSFILKPTTHPLYRNPLSLHDAPPIFSSNKTCSAGCVQSAAFSAGVLASHSVTLTQAGSGALIKVVSHNGTFGTDPSGQSNSFSVSDAGRDHDHTAAPQSSTARIGCPVP